MTTCYEQPSQVQTIIRNSDKTLNTRVINADIGDPYDITLASEIVAVFPSDSSPGYFEKRLSTGGITIASGPGGRVLITLLPIDTIKLTLGESISFELRITIDGKTETVQFLNSLRVVASLFPDAA